MKFLSTPSARRATLLQTPFIQNNFNFYPRPPRGGRQQPKRWHRRRRKFLSTPSARRATGYITIFTEREDISIHALREEGDTTQRRRASVRHGYFYPRPPRGGRLYYFNVPCRIIWISIHALREEGDCRPSAYVPCGTIISIHALREEGDTRFDNYPQ